MGIGYDLVEEGCRSRKKKLAQQAEEQALLQAQTPATKAPQSKFTVDPTLIHAKIDDSTTEITNVVYAREP